MSKALSEEQKKIRDEQIETNRKYIENIDKLLVEIEPFIDSTTKYNNELTVIYSIFEKSHGLCIQGVYADYYTKDLKPANSPMFNSISASISKEFVPLSDIQKKTFQEKLPDAREYENNLKQYMQKAMSLLSDAYSDNSFIIRFEGLDGIYTQLHELSSKSWYCSREGVRDSIMRGSRFIEPIWFHGMNRVNPFHIEIYLTYKPLFLDSLNLKNRLLDAKKILKTVNSNLPFAELSENVPAIQNIITSIDKSTSIGSNTSIGNNNAIGDDTSVEVEEK